MQFSAGLLLFSFLFFSSSLAKSPVPFVVLPSFFRLNATNSLTITPVKESSSIQLVDIDVRVYENIRNSRQNEIFSVKLRAKKAGAAHTVKIDIKPSVSDTVDILISVERHSKFETKLMVKPDLSAIHIHTDKGIYRAGEKVNLRVLPLTYSGTIYQNAIEVALVNPDRFELIRKTVVATDNYASSDFELPDHLFYGEWRVIARPIGSRENDLSYDTTFTVGDYELPPFKISVAIEEGDPLTASRFTIDVKYFHGSPVNGTLAIYCSQSNKNNQTNPAPQTTPIKQSQIVDGYWKQAVSLSSCFTDDQRLATKVLVEIRDQGTGDRGETEFEFDPLASSFDLIPLRPFYNTMTSALSFITIPLGAVRQPSLEVTATCIGGLYSGNVTITTQIGEFFKIDKPKSFSSCYVIMVQAVRLLGNDIKSRSKTVMLPKMEQTPSINPSWIEIQNPEASYKVGSKLMVRVPQKLAVQMNYLILCNHVEVVAAGKIRDDAVLTVTLTSNMIGKCILFVYMTQTKNVVDMIQFYVSEDCQATTFASKAEIKPGNNVTFTLNGDPYGLAVIRSTDDRLNALSLKSESVKTKNWDLSMFQESSLKNHQARLMNFVDVKEIHNSIERSCASAGTEYSVMFGKCPEAKVTPSIVSNYCLKKMIDACLNPKKPTTSASCRKKGGCNTRIASSKEVVVLEANVFAPRVKPKFLLSRPSAAEELFSDPTLPIFDEPDDDGPPIRQHFHEVWLFNAVKLGASGTVSTSVAAPDSIGRWSVATAFWSPGQLDLCRPSNIEIVAKKNYFMEVDMPRHVYINETVSVKISVSALKPQRETKLSVCMADLSRKVCADLGAFGRYGEPVYSRVIVSPSKMTDSKTFTMRFLVTGPTTVLFHLREETSFPGKHHCDIGQIYDSVKLDINIAKRAETEEHYKRLILNADKPLSNVVLLNDDPDDVKRFKDLFRTMPHAYPGFSTNKEIIEVFEHRSSDDANAVVTEIHTNILDTDAVYSFTVDISKFLPNTIISDSLNRVKRGVLDYGNAFLTDIIRKLSTELYQFKRLRTQGSIDIRQIQTSENKIGSLISDMLRFSDCGLNQTSCGFSEFGRPKDESSRSPILSSLAASLFCEASADEKLACGTIKYIQNFIINGLKTSDVDISDMIDIDSPVDRQWLLNALFLQVSKDCAALQCIKNDLAWSKLYFNFYDLDETWRFDDRTLAALAFMGTNSTAEIMRIKMMENIKKDMLPFWTAGTSNVKETKNRLSSFDDISRARRLKSGDVLVNALGILSFVVPGAEGQNLDWDPLANWLYEQQEEDGTFVGALESFFASRALYEYRYRKVENMVDNNLQVTLTCTKCPTYVINVTDTASEIYLPTHIRNLTLTTKGHGKVKAGVRILATKRQRSRRGLTQEDYYPVRFSVEQTSIADGILKQTVCLRIGSINIREIEITHGIFTGYSSKVSNIYILSNSSDTSIVGLPTISSYAAHFVLQGLKFKTPVCYEIGITEPGYHHEPINLAPVAIQARHPVNGIVGMVLIAHPDQVPRFRRNSFPIKIERKLKRDPRGIVDESIDTVCFKGGACACAETSCSVQCGMCARDSEEELHNLISKNENNFAILVTVMGSSQANSGGTAYTRILADVRNKKGYRKQAVSDQLTIWLRECSNRCLPEEDVQNSQSYFLIGDVDGLSVDADGRQHYILRDSDRFEEATKECGDLAKFMLLTSIGSHF